MLRLSRPPGRGGTWYVGCLILGLHLKYPLHFCHCQLQGEGNLCASTVLCYADMYAKADAKASRLHAIVQRHVCREPPATKGEGSMCLCSFSSWRRLCKQYYTRQVAIWRWCEEQDWHACQPAVLKSLAFHRPYTGRQASSPATVSIRDQYQNLENR